MALNVRHVALRSPRRRPKTTESEPPPVMPSHLESADSHRGRKHDAGFSSMPRSLRQLFGGLPRIEVSRSPEDQDSLAAGKNAGNIFDSAVFFAKIRLETGREFSSLRVNSLRRQGREFFCQ